MCSLLPSPLFVYRRAFPCTRISSRWHRSSIHLWHYIRQKTLHGQTALLNYEDLAVPDLRSQSIRLWSRGKYLGLIPAEDVLRNYLGPGQMLWLRGDPPSKSTPRPNAGYDYDVRALEHDRLGMQNANPRDQKGLRAKEYYLTASVSSKHLRNQLAKAYRFLDPESKGPEVRTPVEFHITARGGVDHADLSLFTKERLDLHPAMILRALPEGVHPVVNPKGDIERGDAVWIVATDKFTASPHALPRDLSAKVRKVKKVLDTKRMQLEELIEAGTITPKN